jgi:hypothetical protein
MTERIHHEPWRVGNESYRESSRFRYPVCGHDEQEWPWLALFENRDDAVKAVQRVNAYPDMVAENTELRKRIVALEAEIAALAEPVEVTPPHRQAPDRRNRWHPLLRVRPRDRQDRA